MIAPRVVATDLDGTLLRNDSTLSERTRQALRKTRAKGIKVVAATARPARVVKELFDEQDIDIAICGNGASLYDPEDQKITLTHAMAPDFVASVIEEISRNIPGSGYAVETGHRVLFEPGYTYRPTLDFDRIAVQEVSDLLTEPAVKLMVLLPDEDPDRAWAVLKPVLGQVITCTWSNERAPLEIALPSVTKALALAELCATWGVTAQEVMAFGDAPNDIPMLEWAGMAYAVANAQAAVKAAARHVTAANEDDGVARVLEGLPG
ncbi:Cof-type HAD-IIB family hydrolase [Hamadaea tsunoensis]|uniref:Cof-type HAD-IIB family hydrolase n=1 Tax=Hamadaea tsunoensis TaxID=53368 RepID=UPI0004228DA6|nr:Cof-type HAD-IIB family hydrolase [Hamadaea tsunoensis]